MCRSPRIPAKLINAFVAAEDKNFFDHRASTSGRPRAVKVNLKSYIITAAGVPKAPRPLPSRWRRTFSSTTRRTSSRKARKPFSRSASSAPIPRSEILELYLNEIYLGLNSYGVAAAALNYFGKELQNLDVEEVAYLAALPKAPSTYHPIRNTSARTERRN